MLLICNYYSYNISFDATSPLLPSSPSVNRQFADALKLLVVVVTFSSVATVTVEETQNKFNYLHTLSCTNYSSSSLFPPSSSLNRTFYSIPRTEQAQIVVPFLSLFCPLCLSIS